MTNRRFRASSILAGSLLAGTGYAQVPDLLNAFDAGGRSFGMGGSLHATEPSTLSTYYNPASLGFIHAPETGVDFRTLSDTTTSITGTLLASNYSTSGHSGFFTITHLGFVTPVADFVKHGKGTIGLSYSVGGYMDDMATAPAGGIPDGSIIVQNYKLDRSLKNEFVDLAYGIADASQTASFGIGVTYARSTVDYVETGTATDTSGNPVLFPGADIGYTANGFGLSLGGQVVPATAPNFSLGSSLRTPIQLSNTGPGGIYDRIPGRFLVGASYRRDDLWARNDYLLFGAQFQYFFDGKASLAFDQNSQTDFGFGAEYSHAFSDFRVPIRLGYETASSGGSTFGPANAFTVGFGARPLDDRYSVDFNWALPQRGGTEFALNGTYRFK